VHDDGYFDETVAATYDEDSAERFDPAILEPAVDFLAELAGSGSALEFAIGTGRIALPLSERGVPVHGVDLSTAMVERLRAKPGGDDIGVTIGDFATTQVDGSFSLVYLVYNTIGNLESQDRQVECFANAAAHLEPGGYFVVEVGVPDLRRLVPGHDSVVFAHAPGYVGYDRYDDLVAQHAVSHHFVDDDTGVHEVRTPFRFVWPSELDLMARLAGLDLANRWADWHGSPFTSDCASHVSVWQKQPKT
jgi:SAM-dependent methyltransferase